MRGFFAARCISIVLKTEVANLVTSKNETLWILRVQEIRMLLRSIFEQAVNDDLISKNPIRRLTNGRFDLADSFEQISWFYGHEFESELSVSLFVNSFKTQRFLKADPPRFAARNEAKVPYEEDAGFVDPLVFDAL